ncbi:MAG TPA: FAD-dependent oxidoreductase [Chitinophagaceae bacterium]|nr:FAD-dependent oxidoreductase [Chitinophagaceae bacterium]
MSKVCIIGGGIIGLSSALYLKRSGWDVTVLDKGDFSDNCSYGNAGYVCPSHFIPLATPGIIKMGLKWMFNARSPFYVQPRLDFNLITWGLKFMRSATAEKVEQAAIPLRDIALISQAEFMDWRNIPGFDMALEQQGLIELYQTDAAGEHGKHHVEKAIELGLDARILSMEQIRKMEPGVNIVAKGGIYFDCDSHLYPNKLMKSLIQYLKKEGVTLLGNEEVKTCKSAAGKITHIISEKNEYAADKIVLATGSWSRGVGKMLGLNLPLVAGRGYSLTLENSPYKLNHPSVLMEGRVAITPMDGNKIRFGGTMEITSHKTPPRMNRVQGILDAVKKYYPDFDVALPPLGNIWYGYRPCSADGLPYIGKAGKWENVVVATGHAMVGLSLGAGTGKLVDEIISDKKLSMDISPFNPDRFN